MSAADFGIHRMPVHVENQHIERKVVLSVFPDDPAVVVGTVIVEPAVPRPVHILPVHRRPAADRAQRTQGGTVVRTVYKNIVVLHMCLARLRDPTVHQALLAGIVDHIITVPGEQSLVQFRPAVDIVERGDRPAQIVFRRESGLAHRPPGRLLSPVVELYPEIHRPEREAVGRIGNRHPSRFDPVTVTVQLLHAERIQQMAPVVGKHRGIVEKLTVHGIFEPDQTVGDQRNPVIAEHERVRMISGREGTEDKAAHKQQESFFHQKSKIYSLSKRVSIANVIKKENRARNISEKHTKKQSKKTEQTDSSFPFPDKKPGASP